MIYNKPTGEVFASQANTGESADFPDVLRGWGITKEQTEGKPPMSWMNGAFKRVDENLEYLRQRGIAEWDESLTYPTNAYVQHKGKTWKSKTENAGKEPSVDESWVEWALTKDRILLKDENLAGLSDVSAALINLGLGEAAKRGVGIGINQIPDMSSFTSIKGTTAGSYLCLPGDFILQTGRASTSATSATLTNLVIPFPKSSYNVIGVAIDQAVPNIISCAPQTASAFFLSAWGANSVTHLGVRQPTSVYWIAFGY